MSKLQDEIRHWWESKPMTYDWCDTNLQNEGAREWFEEIDRRLVGNGTHYFAQDKGQKPFSKLIPFDELKGRDVLEIGCGSGVHARLIAESGAKLKAIDLTTKAVDLTRQRLQLWGLNADVQSMDAESLDFPDKSFDLVWSWGVIHHSSNTPRIVAEIARVLRPAGQVRVMVYNRRSINFLVCLIRGFLSGRLFSLGIEETLNYYSDGRIAQYYTREKFEGLFLPYFDSIETCILGNKSDLVPIPRFGILGKFKTFLISTIPDSWASAILSRVGGFIFLVAGRRSDGCLDKPSHDGNVP